MCTVIPLLYAIRCQRPSTLSILSILLILLNSEVVLLKSRNANVSELGLPVLSAVMDFWRILAYGRSSDRQHGIDGCPRSRST